MPTKKINRLILFSLSAIILLGFVHVYAQALKIGVFDIQKIIRDSKTIEGYRQEITKSIEAMAKPIRAKEESLRTMEDKLRKQLQVMSVEERRELEEKIANEAKEIKRMKEDLDIHLRKMDRDLTQKAFKEIAVIVKNIADKENYTIIFERSAAGIAQMKDSVDITNKILKQIK